MSDISQKVEVFLAIFSVTELIIVISRAKNCGESDFEVGFDVAPQKPDENTEKLISVTRKMFFLFFRD